MTREERKARDSETGMYLLLASLTVVGGLVAANWLGFQWPSNDSATTSVADWLESVSPGGATTEAAVSFSDPGEQFEALIKKFNQEQPFGYVGMRIDENGRHVAEVLAFTAWWKRLENDARIRFARRLGTSWDEVCASYEITNNTLEVLTADINPNEESKLVAEVVRGEVKLLGQVEDKSPEDANP